MSVASQRMSPQMSSYVAPMCSSEWTKRPHTYSLWCSAWGGVHYYIVHSVLRDVPSTERRVSADRLMHQVCVSLSLPVFFFFFFVFF